MIQGIDVNIIADILEAIYLQYSTAFAVAFMIWLPICSYIVVKHLFQEGFQGGNFMVPAIGFVSFSWSVLTGYTSIIAAFWLFSIASGLLGFAAGLGVVWYIAEYRMKI